jgi:WD40 repeat protein
LRYSPDGKLLATASGTRQVLALWETRTWHKVAELAGHRNGIWDLAFIPDGKELISASRDHTVKFWRPQVRPKPQATPEAQKIIGFLPDSKTAILLQTTRLILWDMTSSQETRTHPLTPGKLASSGAITGDGVRAAIGYQDGTVEVRDLDSGVVRRSFTAFTNPVFRVRLSPNGKEVTAITHFLPGQMSLLGRLALWNVTNGESMSDAVTRVGGTATAVAFSHDGRLVAIARADNSISIWDLVLKEERSQCKGHTWDVTGVSFSPDNRTLASGSWDGTTRLWSVATGEEQAKLAGGGELCFSPDGRTLAAAPMSSPVRLHHVRSQQEIMTLRRNGSSSGEVFFSADGAVLGVGAFDMELDRTNRVQLWRAPSHTQPNPLP